MELNLDLGNSEEDNKQEAVEKVRKAKKAKKPLLTMEEAWAKIMNSTGVKKSEKKTKEMLECQKLLSEGEISREPDKIGKNFTGAEASRIYKAYKHEQNIKFLESLITRDLDLFKLVNTKHDFRRVIESFLDRDSSYVACDTETHTYKSTPDGFSDRIVGYSFTWRNKDGTMENFYVPMYHLNAQGDLDKRNADPKDAIALIRYIFKHAPRIIFHNAPYDGHVVRENFGFTPSGEIIDTYLMAKMIDENRLSYALKPLSNAYLGEDSMTYQEMFGKDAKFDTVDIGIARWYASKDTYLTFLLYEFFMRIFAKPAFQAICKAYFDIEVPVTPIAIAMEAQGFRLIRDELETQLVKASAMLKRMDKELIAEFGDINFNSPAQLVTALFVDRDNSKYLEKGEKPSSNKVILKRLANIDPAVQLLVSRRKLAKHISSFLESLPKQVRKDGLVHGTFNQIGTVTLRFSAEKPNLQQQSNGFKLEDTFFSSRDLLGAPEGSLILEADFGRQEITWMGDLSGDKAMIELTNGKLDVYGWIASQVWGKPYIECIDNEELHYKSPWRGKAKVLMLAISYEMTEHGLAPMLGLKDEKVERFYIVNSRGTVGQLRFMSEKKAKEHVEQLPEPNKYKVIAETVMLTAHEQALEIIEMLDEIFPDLRAWKESVKKETAVKFYVDSRFGARRRLTQERRGKYGEEGYYGGDFYLNWKGQKVLAASAERQAINFMVQNAAADQTKRAMILSAYMFERLEEKYPNRKFRFAGQVHDALLFFLPPDVSWQELELIQWVMISASINRICGRTDLVIGTTWGNMDAVINHYPEFKKVDGDTCEDYADNDWQIRFNKVKEDIDKFIDEGEMVWRK